jgi:hypothetical protein
MVKESMREHFLGVNKNVENQFAVRPLSSFWPFSDANKWNLTII